MLSTQVRLGNSRIIPADSRYVSIDRNDAADYWCCHFGATRDELEQAVEAVGHGYGPFK
jgi:hypothetical protein